MSLYRVMGKRTFDIAGAVITLPLLGIATLFIAPAIKIDNNGPVFYRSQRRGRNGEHFTMLKFRSMVADAPDLRNADLSTLTSATDPRVTRIGRLLRRTSVDELPQILNVLRGDMSFVGPRPNMTLQTWEELSDVEKKRVRVRPGITGLTQALYRNSISTARKYQLDCAYVDRVSFSVDLKIILRTAISVSGAKNIHAIDESPIHGSGS